MPAVSQDEPSLLVNFHADIPRVERRGGTYVIHLPIPILAGSQCAEPHPLPGAEIIQDEQVLLMETDQDLIGAIIIPAPGRLEEPTRQAYTQLLSSCTERGMHLHRVWNYVPDINAVTQGLENYRQFNIGRWLAFENLFGRDLRAFMPAASAVGISSPHVILVFIAGKTQPVYLENPSQIPAYHYPSEYGPRPPSFARAVLVHTPEIIQGYLSGTASIEGHVTVGEGDWHQQFRTTLRNIRIMLERMGMTELLKNARAFEKAQIILQDLRCYLRHAEMLPLLQDWFNEEAPWIADRIIYQQADICRADLDLEIEAILYKRIGK